jgi:formylmethanofuran dehydrogenase subunit D
MARISGLLVTVRSAKQGAEMMKSKLTEDYLQEISSLRISAEDMAELALSDGDKARLASPHGAISVTCHPTDVPKGLFFLPLGPLANRLFSGADTDGTGVPDWKRQQVTVEPAGEHSGNHDPSR